MARLSTKLTYTLQGLSIVGGRNTGENRKVVGWNKDTDTLWAYSDMMQAIALVKLHNRKDIERLPDRNCFMKPCPGWVRYNRTLEVLDVETRANPAGFYELFDLGKRLKRFKSEEEGLLARAYGELLWEETEGRIRRTCLHPFYNWSFDYVDIHENGIKMLAPDKRQVLILYRHVEYKKNPRKKLDAKLSDVLVEI